MSEVTTHRFEAEVSQVLKLVINSLYSHKEIFLRELISNASDAIDKLKYLALTDHKLLNASEELAIRVWSDSEKGTLTISDNGIGMSTEELIQNLGTVAHSGTGHFLQALAEKGSDSPELIGQFGVGFYSAFLVADKVEVISKKAGESSAHRWESAANDTFEISSAERDEQGTTIILHLNEEQKQYLSPWTLRELIVRYSDFVSHPIYLQIEKYGETSEEGEEPKLIKEFEQINQGKALWQRRPQDVEPDEYNEFYKHLTHDWEPPLTYSHFKVEGQQLFDGLLFVPQRPPFDLYARDQRHGVRLYVKRVFIMDDCKELLPSFLRFIKGVVDSDDLPLNVSRELLQDSAVVRFIKKQLTKKTFDMLSDLSKDEAIYREFWKSYGPVLKEGLYTNPEHKKRLLPLLRFHATRDPEGFISLADYREKMVEGQEHIYYLIGQDAKLLAQSPHIEALKSKGYEVLLLTDPIDEWAINGVESYEDISLKSAMHADLDVESNETEQSEETKDKPLASLVELIATTLGDRVQEVKVSKRLLSTPACLVIPDGGVGAQMEKLLAATQPGFEKSKRIFEVNTDHPLLKTMEALRAKDVASDDLKMWIEVLYQQAVVSEGGALEDPFGFAKNITELLEKASQDTAKANAISI